MNARLFGSMLSIDVSHSYAKSAFAWTPEGRSDSMDDVDLEVLTRLFQHQILETMVELRRLSRDFAQKLRAWHPSGFGVYRRRPIECDDRPALERLAA